MDARPRPQKRTDFFMKTKLSGEVEWEVKMIVGEVQSTIDAKRRTATRCSDRRVDLGSPKHLDKPTPPSGVAN
jgi:hypothetical protein